MNSTNNHLLNWIVHQLGTAHHLTKHRKRIGGLLRHRFISSSSSSSSSSSPWIRNNRLQSTSASVKLDQSKNLKEDQEQQSPRRVCPISGATATNTRTTISANNNQTDSIHQISLDEFTLKEKQQNQFSQQRQQQQPRQDVNQTDEATGESDKNNNQQASGLQIAPRQASHQWQQEQQQQQQQHQQNKSNSLPFEAIPGPGPSLPFIGTQWIYFPIVGYYKPMKLHEANLDKYRRYGPIMKEEFRGHSTVTIFDPSDMKEVFMREAVCPSRPVLPFVIRHRQSDPDRYPNVGLANMQGSEWYDLRSNLGPLLLSRGLKQRYISTQNRVSDHLVNYIRESILLPANRTREQYNYLDDDNADNHDYINTTSRQQQQQHQQQMKQISGIVENIQEVCYRFSIESIMKLCLNQELGCLRQATNSDISGSSSSSSSYEDRISLDVENIFQAAMKFFEAQHKLSFGLGLIKYIDAKPFRQLCDSQNAIHDIASKYIDDALDNMKQRHSYLDDNNNSKLMRTMASPYPMEVTNDQQEDYIVDDSEHESLLETLYCTKKFTDLEIKSTIVDFISGGIYLVANTLTMVLFLLASNPSVQERLYQEICQVFSSSNVYDNNNNNNNNNFYNNKKIDSDIDIDMDKLKQLKYLKLCLKESYRLLPTIPGVARTLQRDMVLSNYLVPKNTTVFCNFMVTCRLPEYFTNPDEYNPNRWEKNELDDKNGNDLAFSLLPFGHGVSKCIGHNFAELEIYVAIAKLVRSFKIRTINNENVKSLNLCYKFIVVPEKPVTLEFIPRQQV